MDNIWVRILVCSVGIFLAKAVVPAIFRGHDKAVTPTIAHLNPTSEPLAPTYSSPVPRPSYSPLPFEPRHQTPISEPSYQSQKPAPNYQDDTQRSLQQEAERSQQNKLQNAKALCDEYYQQSLDQASSGQGYATFSSMMIFQCSMVESKDDVNLLTLKVNLAGAKHLCEEYTAKTQGGALDASNAAMQTFYCGQAMQQESDIVQLQLQMQQEALQNQESSH